MKASALDIALRFVDRISHRDPGGSSHWKIPAAWKAVVRDERIAEWRVYANNEPVWKVMGIKR